MSSLASAFLQSTRKASTFEDIRWIVWLYDSLEREEWEDVKWKAWVLSEKGYNGLLLAVDEHHGHNLSQ